MLYFRVNIYSVKDFKIIFGLPALQSFFFAVFCKFPHCWLNKVLLLFLLLLLRLLLLFFPFCFLVAKQPDVQVVPWSSLRKVTQSKSMQTVAVVMVSWHFSILICTFWMWLAIKCRAYQNSRSSSDWGECQMTFTPKRNVNEYNDKLNIVIKIHYLILIKIKFPFLYIRINYFTIESSIKRWN